MNLYWNALQIFSLCDLCVENVMSEKALYRFGNNEKGKEMRLVLHIIAPVMGPWRYKINLAKEKTHSLRNVTFIWKPYLYGN